ncbi:MAG: HTH-type transcriptional regulator MhqR [Firmicutes bacterium ADurb.Bin456]|nr:MAG: HTH-type transcriptional regulator MhqR [Firmicutes bacterium ADurb.Bin456]
MDFSLDESIGFILNRTNAKLKNEFHQRLKTHNVTPEQWAVLNRLWERDGVSPKEISVSIFKDLPNTVRILDKLNRKGLIMRRTNPLDRRAHLIYITSEGLELKGKLVPLAKGILTKALDGIGSEKTRELKDMLNRMYYNMV